MLPASPEYIVNTSEFDDVKARLASIENRHKVTNEKDQGNRPTLRRATADHPAQDSSGSSGSSGSSQPADDRPTLKRSDGSGSQSFQ